MVAACVYVSVRVRVRVRAGKALISHSHNKALALPLNPELLKLHKNNKKRDMCVDARTHRAPRTSRSVQRTATNLIVIFPCADPL